MTTILLVFAGLEAALLAWTAVALGRGRYQGMELFAPVGVAMYGTGLLTVAFLATTFIHDHIRLAVR